MNYILLIVSSIIYLSYGLPNCIYIVFSLLSSYFVAKHVKKRKMLLAITIILNTGILVFVKFLPYTNWNLLTPLGVSYYTLQVISYLVDVYKGKYKYEENFFNYALYIMYIPHLFIGSITRYDEMKEQLQAKRKITLENLLSGILRILLGISKKTYNCR